VHKPQNSKKPFVCNITATFQCNITKRAAQFKLMTTVTGTPQSVSMGASSPYKCVHVKWVWAIWCHSTMTV